MSCQEDCLSLRVRGAAPGIADSRARHARKAARMIQDRDFGLPVICLSLFRGAPVI